jgi:hypothetical protein
MKIALLLTGQLRTVDMVKYLHMNSIIKKYDTDVFLSIDLNNSKQCEYKNNTDNTHLDYTKEIISFFNPINYYICNDYSTEFKILKKKQSELCNIDNIDINFMLLFEQYYIVKQAYKLLIEHINKTNTTYDIIIRLRFDQFIWTDESHDIIHLINKTVNNQIIYNSDNVELLNKISQNNTINFNQPNDKEICLLGFGDICHYKYANDQFWYHSPKLINVIFMFYDNIYRLLYDAIKNKNGNCGAMIEHLWHTYLVNNNINIKKGVVSGVFVREFV